VYDINADEYGDGSKEFPLPDNGLADEDAMVVGFLARVHGIAREDVTFDNLAAVEGVATGASLDVNGDLMVGGGA
jgi:hypothetical protein